MKYVFVGFVVSSVQIIFMIAFALCALTIGMSNLLSKRKAQNISVKIPHTYRVPKKLS